MSINAPSAPAGMIFAFLFSDIEGSAARWERHGKAMQAAISRHDSLLTAAIEAHGGHIFKTVGGQFFVAFGTVGQAVAAAVAGQRGLVAEEFSAVEGLRVRIAIHAGPAESRDQDYFGPTLNRVARLMTASHGGQIVLSGAAAAMARGDLPEGCTLEDLGRHRLKDLIEAEQVFQAQAPDLPARFPPLASLGSTPNNLPQQPTSFVGREQELAEVASLLEKYRLVTLLGPGGLGKTRLSLQVGAELLERYPDGVWFIELAPLVDPGLLPETVGNLFGLPGREGRDAVDAVTSFVRHKKLLLILDNCEHLVASAAAFADALIGICPGVSVLASSREALGIPAEHVVRLPMLAVPKDITGLTASAAIEFPAIRLFVERAAASLGRFVLSDADTEAVAGICRRLDGIALAIELAAPRLKMLKPAQLLTKLDDRFRVLTGGSRAALPRQQTLRGLIDWSHDLLTEAERILMRRLAVFADGWTLEAATAVTSGDGIEDWEVFDLLASLVDKSLVTADPSGREARFRYLETTRHYAAEKLVEAGEARFRARLATWLAEFFRHGEVIWETTSTPDWLPIYGPEIDNLRSSLEWAFGPEGDPETGLALAGYSHPLWRELAIDAERQRWAQIAAAHLKPETPHGIAARIYRLLGSRTITAIASMVPVRRQAVEEARLAGEPLLLAGCLAMLGTSLPRGAATLEGPALLAEALEIARPFGPTRLLARIHNSRGLVARIAQDHRTAWSHYEESLSVARAMGDVAGMVIPLGNLAASYAENGELQLAITKGREALAAARAAAMKPSEMINAANLSANLYRAGHFEEAFAMASDTVTLSYSLGETVTLGLGAVILALGAARRGQPFIAARLWGWVEAVFRAEGFGLGDEEVQIEKELRTALEAGLSETERVSLLAEGAAMSVDQVVALTREI